MSLKEILDEKNKTEETEKERIARLKKRESYFNEIKQAFIAEQNNQNLIKILKFLFTFCGYSDITDVSINYQNSEVSATTTLYNSTLRSVYARLRLFMPKSLKIKVEFDD